MGKLIHKAHAKEESLIGGMYVCLAQYCHLDKIPTVTTVKVTPL
jgi:hypothetical protein